MSILTRCGVTSMVILYCFLSGAFAFNHPEIKWKTVPTKHFNIHFYDKTEPAVYAAWKIAEQAYEAFDSLYHLTSTEKINLALADYDDYSNGFADWTQRAIMVWIPEARFDLRGNTTWLRDVITHELAHIMSLDRKKRFQLMAWTLGLHYTSPDITAAYMEPFAMTPFMPMWFAEGTAQVRAGDMGADCWDSRRDMLLRCAVMQNRQLTLEEMGHFTHDHIGNEMVYNQGYSFVRFLENRLGKEKIARIWNAARGFRFNGMSLDRFLRDDYAVSLEQLYVEWLHALKSGYAAAQPKTFSATTAIWELGTINTLPKVSNDGRYAGWLTNHKDDFDRTDLIIAPYGSTAPIVRIRYAQTDWDFSPDGNRVYYIKARSPDRNGSFLNDIFVYDLVQQKERRLTYGARVYAVTAAPDGKDLVCVLYKENKYALVRFSLSDAGFSTVQEGIAGEPFITVAFLPAVPKTMIVSRIVNGTSDIFTLHADSTVLVPLVCSGAQEETPFCAPDGRVYFSADYDGVFNIYSVKPDGSGLMRHSTVPGGAFTPVKTGNGALLFSEYTARGFRIVTGSSEGTAYHIPDTPACFFGPLPTPTGKVRIHAVPYEGKLLRPSWELSTQVACTDGDKAFQDLIRFGEIRDSSWDINLDVLVDIGMTRSDAVGRKDMYFGGALLLNGSWAPDNDSVSGPGPDSLGVISSRSHAWYNTRPKSLQRQEKKKQGRMYQTVQRDLQLVEHLAQQSGTTNDSAEERASVFSLPFLVPYAGLESRAFASTIGFSGQMVLVSMVPAMLYIDPYIEWHIARDVYLGFSPEITFMPYLLFSGTSGVFGCSAPFWVQWFYPRYINEDFAYNYNGASLVSGFIGPEVTPYINVTDSYDSNGGVVSDTTVASATSLTFGFAGMHAFPLTRHASFMLRTGNTGIRFKDDMSGSIEYGKATTAFRFLFTSDTRASVTFPCIRNINRGRLYADNLYATPFYELHFVGTDRYFADPVHEAFTQKTFDSDAVAVSHWIGLGMELGTIKNYAFARPLRFEAAWDALDNDFKCDVSFGF